MPDRAGLGSERVAGREVAALDPAAGAEVAASDPAAGREVAASDPAAGGEVAASDPAAGGEVAALDPAAGREVIAPAIAAALDLCSLRAVVGAAGHGDESGEWDRCECAGRHAPFDCNHEASAASG